MSEGCSDWRGWPSWWTWCNGELGREIRGDLVKGPHGGRRTSSALGKRTQCKLALSEAEVPKEEGKASGTRRRGGGGGEDGQWL